MRRTRWVIALTLAACGGSDGGPADAGADAADGSAPNPWETPFLWTLAAPHACPAEPVAGDLLDGLAGDLGLAWPVGIPRSLYESIGGRIADDPARLSFVHPLQEDVRLIPCAAGNLASRADAAVASDHPIASMLADAATQLDLEITVGGSWDDPPGEAVDLIETLDDVQAGEMWDRDAVAAAAEDVPQAVREAAAFVLRAAREAAALRDQAFAAMSGDGDLDRLFTQGAQSWLAGPGPAVDPDTPEDAGLFVGGAEGSAVLYRGAIRLAQALDEIDWTALFGTDSRELYVETPLGAVLIRGAGDDVYDPDDDPRLAGPLLLVLDLGGDDTYRIPAGATSSAQNPVAVHVDLGGDDVYGYVEDPDPRDVEGLLPSDGAGRYAGDADYGTFSLSPVARQGAGVLGYGLLLDLGAGNDDYRSHRKSQGFANFGAGVLWDDGGQDTYVAENGAQGSALVGVALLYDGGGDDTYRSFGSSQGFAWVSSFGALYDAGGRDAYELVVDEVLLFPSPQTPGTANSSLGQGTAFGWRRDATGTHLSGGLALLRDRGGNDTYEGSTFAQGTGYWMGLGVLADAGGDDTYDGLFYAQGAGAHFALAAFLEGGGDDRYNTRRPPLHSAIGLGHDFSTAFFVDGGGVDTYVGPDRSVGASKCHGVGVAVDRAGDDAYATHQKAIGWATDYDWAPGSCGDSTTLPSVGLFVDAGGADTYAKPDASLLGDDRAWSSDDPDDPDALEIAGGVDGQGDTAARAYGDTP
jgi:hypothetical protein